MYEAIILAGGFGTRLRDVVPDVPKPMAIILDKPFLAWQIEYLIRSGVSRFILAVGYKAEIIKSYFGTAYLGAKILYSRESEPLGTGGAINLALTQAKSDRVFVFNGDSLCDINLKSLRDSVCEKNNAIGICIKYIENANRYGSVVIDKNTNIVTRFAEKSEISAGFINTGIYDISRNMFELLNIPASFSFENDILQKKLNGDLIATKAGEFFIDIGIPEDFQRAQIDIPAWCKRKL